jgi:hypothetical protein
MTEAEHARVLNELCARHPEIRGEAEELARADLAAIAAEEVAGEVAWVLEDLQWEDIAGRLGYQPGRGYVHPNEAAWELLSEALQPFLDDIGRRAGLGLGLDQAAVQVALGVVAGLYDCRDAGDGTVLGEAGEDAVSDLADEAVRALRRAGLTLPPGALEERCPDWRDLL